ncbi:RNA polymerase sigma-70 factor, ECF subfamily [Pedobacter westerhofensis]|uniref:RNA polymerase sigma-70 factor, ECF subfamily n=1 Tax=Pedobacter westerhofensis TaxID=425512 RepID=A0A521EYF7_9SPHI|nr:sigma-70 family RNA polymerase sigma factor [Pedobacter westerhofensis]SMO88893.1 RNA polymerase sigma-70 factor, ECF subfamily [Pedobacter westerhofensis]
MKSKKLFLTEENLILALKNQEPIAMRALYDMYSYSLGGVIFRILNHTELSEDVLQEVILKIWTSGNHYNPRRGRLFTWMLNLTRNYTLDILRTKRYRNGRKTVNIDDCHPAIDKQRNVYYNPEAILIKELVNQLKPEFNILLEMVYFKGYTHLETSEELNLPLGTVKTRIRMAIMELRTQFD